LSRKELATLASRALALYLTAWLISDLTYLPERVYSFLHETKQQSVLLAQGYWYGHYKIVLVFALIRILALLCAAIFFWQCGPKAQGLFLSDRNGDIIAKK
jgi:hypothetical protein